MTRRSPAGAFFDALSLPVRLLGRGLAEDENARVRVAEDAYVLDIDLPGFQAEDFEVDWEDGYLSVTATDAAGRYAEQFHFPDIVDADGIRAAYDADAGRLTVRLPVVERSPRAAGAAAGAERGTAD
jgi:HSP20 family molecular chaperone IbpA